MRDEKRPYVAVPNDRNAAWPPQRYPTRTGTSRETKAKAHGVHRIHGNRLAIVNRQGAEDADTIVPRVCDYDATPPICSDAEWITKWLMAMGLSKCAFT